MYAGAPSVARAAARAMAFVATAAATCLGVPSVATSQAHRPQPLFDLRLGDDRTRLRHLRNL